PRISPENHRSLFCTAAGWGEYFANTVGGRRIHRILLQAGKLALSEFTIGMTPAEGTNPTKRLRVTYNGVPFEAAGKVANNRMVISFTRPLRMTMGSTLEVSWDLGNA
ncbi:MAG: hypothetical protein ACYCUV_14595, partial [Phycisphaerae bacterium]